MRKKRKTIYLEVTKKEIYGFEEKSINGWSTKDVIKYWFDEYNINVSHASRDGHHFGNIDTIVSIKEVTPEEFEPRLKEYFANLEETKKKAKAELDAIYKETIELGIKLARKWKEEND